MPKMICEAGHEINTDHKCYHCGAEPGPNSHCRGESRLEQELKDARAQIVQLRLELARYKEREATIGWADV